MSAERLRLMAHLVAGYPDADGSKAVARGLVEGGAAYLEVQIPFSDPSADGPTIMGACSAALAGGFKVADAFVLIADLHRDYPDIPIFAMTYASLVSVPGPSAFVDACRRAGVSGLIVPDLPFDADEGLAEVCAAQGLFSVPVAAPSMRKERLAAMVALGRPYLYAALRVGITGTATEFDETTRAFLTSVGAGGAKVLGGFGIRSGVQARAVAPSVHAVVVGSVFVDAVSAVLSAQRANRRRGYKGSPRVRDEAIRQTVREMAEKLTLTPPS